MDEGSTEERIWCDDQGPPCCVKIDIGEIIIKKESISGDERISDDEERTLNAESCSAAEPMTALAENKTSEGTIKREMCCDEQEAGSNVQIKKQEKTFEEEKILDGEAEDLEERNCTVAEPMFVLVEGNMDEERTIKRIFSDNQKAASTVQDDKGTRTIKEERISDKEGGEKVYAAGAIKAEYSLDNNKFQSSLDFDSPGPSPEPSDANHETMFESVFLVMPEIEVEDEEVKDKRSASGESGQGAEPAHSLIVEGNELVEKQDASDGMNYSPSNEVDELSTMPDQQVARVQLSCRKMRIERCNKSKITRKSPLPITGLQSNVDDESDITSAEDSALKCHLTDTKEKRLQCDHCGKSFFHVGHFKAHLRTHTGEKPFQCDECEKRFTEKKHVNAHRMIHTGEKPFQCDQCEQKFSRKGYLTIHRRIHTGEKPFQCDVCEKRFSISSNLVAHRKTHAGEKPHQCNFCTQKFTRNRNLKVHLRVHTGEKPFQCDECEQWFSHLSYLKVHKRVHTGEKLFQCNECNQKFAKKSNLVRHQRIHSGEKPFKCDHCEKTFSDKKGVVIHQMTHTGEKPFQCDECERMFSTNYEFKKHLRTHSGGETVPMRRLRKKLH